MSKEILEYFNVRFKGIFSGSFAGKNFLELGSSNELCPLCLSIIAKLNGANLCVSTDTNMWKELDLYNSIKTVLEIIKCNPEKYIYGKISACNFVNNLNLLQISLLSLDNADKWFKKNNIYFIPLSYSSNRYLDHDKIIKINEIEIFKDNLIDIFFSISVLEHISNFKNYFNDSLLPILSDKVEFCSIIDLSDHRIQNHSILGEYCEFSFMSRYFNNIGSEPNVFHYKGSTEENNGAFQSIRLIDYQRILKENKFYPQKIIKHRVKNVLYPKHISEEFLKYSRDELENTTVEINYVRNMIPGSSDVIIDDYADSMFTNSFINKYNI